MLRTLAAMAEQVLDDTSLKQSEKREELLKIADRMAKLRDTDRIYKAEQLLRGADQTISETTLGPQVIDAQDLNEQASPVTARRGRPPKRSLR